MYWRDGKMASREVLTCQILDDYYSHKEVGIIVGLMLRKNSTLARSGGKLFKTAYSATV